MSSFARGKPHRNVSVDEAEHPERYLIFISILDVILDGISLACGKNLFFPLLRPPTSNVLPSTSKSDTGDQKTSKTRLIQQRNSVSRMFPIREIHLQERKPVINLFHLLTPSPVFVDLIDIQFFPPFDENEYARSNRECVEKYRSSAATYKVSDRLSFCLMCCSIKVDFPTPFCPRIPIRRQSQLILPWNDRKKTSGSTPDSA